MFSSTQRGFPANGAIRSRTLASVPSLTCLPVSSDFHQSFVQRAVVPSRGRSSAVLVQCEGLWLLRVLRKVIVVKSWSPGLRRLVKLPLPDYALT